ncbi:MAG: carbon-nitrogen hydrolase family protein, partial [Candidatus Tectimicrobiota bacterium]
LDGPSVGHIRAQAARLGEWAGAGFVERDSASGRLHNCYILVDRQGAVVATYRKLHRWWHREREFFTAGDRFGLADTEFGRLGIMICYDGRFPEVARALTLEGAQLIVWPQHWPWPPYARPQHLEILGRSRAIENSVYVATVNRTGRDQAEGIVYCGHSFIADPLGDFVAAGGEREGVLIGEVDTDLIAATHARVNAFVERRPELYRSIVERREPSS